MKGLLATQRTAPHTAALQARLSHYSSRSGGFRATPQKRRPQLGSVTVVGREEAVTMPSFLTSPSVPQPSPVLNLMHRWGIQPRPLLFDGHGVPVDGSLVTLPAAEKLRVVAAMLLAFAATKLVFDVACYECVYHNVWNSKWKHSADGWRRAKYYAGFTAATVGASSLYATAFLAIATITGRHRLAARMVCRSAALVLPRRLATVLARRLHV